MSHWESDGKSNDWYTPKFIFDALGCVFDEDVAAASDEDPWHVPCPCWYASEGLTREWRGFVWMNPPFGPRNGLEPWLEKFFDHGNGIALTPDRTSAPWFRQYAPRAGLMLFLPKVRFLRPDGTEGKSPSNGTVLWAIGRKGEKALKRAEKLGFLLGQP